MYYNTVIPIGKYCMYGADRHCSKGASRMQNLQDTFLNRARQDKVPVTVFMTNGFQMRGEIRGFDNFVVLVDSDGKQQMIYKHAISTITPSRPVDCHLEAQKS